jgi:DNA-binding Lrp family transcriptional regulator
MTGLYLCNKMKEEDKRTGDTYFMVIPADVWDNPNLSPTSIILFGHIMVQTNKKKYSWAGNTDLADRLGISENTLKKSLKELEDNGMITRQLIYKENSKEIKERRIFVNVGITGGLNNLSQGQAKKLGQGLGPKVGPDNNKSTNNKKQQHDILFNQPNEEELVRKQKEDNLQKELNWGVLNSVWTTQEYDSAIKSYKKDWMKITLQQQQEIITFCQQNEQALKMTSVWKKDFFRTHNASIEWLKGEIKTRSSRKRSTGLINPDGEPSTEF